MQRGRQEGVSEREGDIMGGAGRRVESNGRKGNRNRRRRGRKPLQCARGVVLTPRPRPPRRPLLDLNRSRSERRRRRRRGGEVRDAEVKSGGFVGEGDQVGGEGREGGVVVCL
jgi:hypothetical protein